MIYIGMRKVEILSRYYIKRYHQWFKASGFVEHKVISQFGSIYDHMYHYFTEVMGLEEEIAVSMIDEYRVDEVLQAVSKRIRQKE